jgi:hypothetical protein
MGDVSNVYIIFGSKHRRKYSTVREKLETYEG